jgi:hypothetical protein
MWEELSRAARRAILSLFMEGPGFSRAAEVARNSGFSPKAYGVVAESSMAKSYQCTTCGSADSCCIWNEAVSPRLFRTGFSIRFNR